MALRLTTSVIVIRPLRAEAFLVAETPDHPHDTTTPILAGCGVTRPGWYLTRQWPGRVGAGPLDSLRACYEAAGVEYPGETTLRTPGGQVSGDLEAVVRS